MPSEVGAGESISSEANAVVQRLASIAKDRTLHKSLCLLKGFAS